MWILKEFASQPNKPFINKHLKQTKTATICLNIALFLFCFFPHPVKCVNPTLITGWMTTPSMRISIVLVSIILINNSIEGRNGRVNIMWLRQQCLQNIHCNSCKIHLTGNWFAPMPLNTFNCYFKLKQAVAWLYTCCKGQNLARLLLYHCQDLLKTSIPRSRRQ